MEYRLCEAIRNCDTSKALTLLEASDVSEWINIPVLLGNTCLWVACIRNNKAVVNKILKIKNINIDKVGGSGYTPLRTAKLLRYTEIVELLLSHGADRENSTPLQYVANNDGTDTLEFLLPNSRKHINTVSKFSQLHNFKPQTSDDLVLKVNQLEIECNELKTENSDLKARVSKLEETVRPKTNNNFNNKKSEANSLVQCIQNNFTYLLERMCADDHLDYLYQERALTTEDCQVISSKAGDIGKTREMLLRLLRKKNADWVKVLQESMQRSTKDLLCIFN